MDDQYGKDGGGKHFCCALFYIYARDGIFDLLR